MAGGAPHPLVRADQREIGHIVVERVDELPVGFIVAARAVAAEAALVDIVLAVAADAGGRRSAECGTRPVATLAPKSAVFAADREIALLVVEVRLSELRDVRVTTPVFGMAKAALRFAHLIRTPMEAGFRSYVAGDILVASHASPPLCQGREREVTGRAFRL
jgi:hypothetical protein